MNVDTMKNLVSSIMFSRWVGTVKAKWKAGAYCLKGVICYLTMHFSMLIPKLTPSLLPAQRGHRCEPMDNSLANNCMNSRQQNWWIKQQANSLISLYLPSYETDMWICRMVCRYWVCWSSLDVLQQSVYVYNLMIINRQYNTQGDSNSYITAMLRWHITLYFQGQQTWNSSW